MLCAQHSFLRLKFTFPTLVLARNFVENPWWRPPVSERLLASVRHPISWRSWGLLTTSEPSLSLGQLLAVRVSRLKTRKSLVANRALERRCLGRGADNEYKQNDPVGDVGDQVAPRKRVGAQNRNFQKSTRRSPTSGLCCIVPDLFGRFLR